MTPLALPGLALPVPTLSRLLPFWYWLAGSQHSPAHQHAALAGLDDARLRDLGLRRPNAIPQLPADFFLP